MINTIVLLDKEFESFILKSMYVDMREIWQNKRKKLTPEKKSAKKKYQKEYMTVFMNGKQKRVKCQPTIDGMDVDDFIRNNADPIWLHQNEMWEYIDQDEN